MLFFLDVQQTKTTERDRLSILDALPVLLSRGTLKPVPGHDKTGP